MKMDIENAKQDIQMKISKGHTYSTHEGGQLEEQAAEMKAENGVTTLRVGIILNIFICALDIERTLILVKSVLLSS